MKNFENFVDRLSSISLPDVFNPYSDTCPLFDCVDAPNIRKANLVALLKAAHQLNVKSIWVARDLGYRGGRRTGLALTDEFHMSKQSDLFGGVGLRKTTIGPMVKERTATTIWGTVERIGEPVFMWNAFPLHPHDHGEPMSNRCHKTSERKSTSWVLDAILELLRPEKVYSIGADAKRCLATMGVETTAFRHPSYGGQTEFIAQVEKAYGLPLGEAPQTWRSKQLELI